MCVYEREKVCKRDRGYVCEFVHAKMSVRICLCLCVSVRGEDRERERRSERERERKEGGRVWERIQPRGGKREK